MEKHTCKLCSRRFSCGRALGGHMRSHAPFSPATQPAARKQRVVVLLSGDHSAFSTSSSAETPTVMAEAPVVAAVVAEEVGQAQVDVKGTSGASYRLRENPRKSSRLVDPEFSFLAAGDGEPAKSVVQDSESETESPGAFGHRRRSKRPRRTTFLRPPSPPESTEPASSASCTTTDEDLAICLMMLSRDTWTTKSEPTEVGDEEDDADDGASGGESRPEKRRSRHQCGTCKKTFRSYQALGGHRAASHKIGGHEDDAMDDDETKVHRCPYCFRAFHSGQALGGHKRSHLMSSTGGTIAANSQVSVAAQPCSPASASPATSSAAKCDKSVSLIDLNLPAPIDDDMEFSAVFDPVP